MVASLLTTLYLNMKEICKVCKDIPEPNDFGAEPYMIFEDQLYADLVDPTQPDETEDKD